VKQGRNYRSDFGLVKKYSLMENNLKFQPDFKVMDLDENLESRKISNQAR